LIADLSVAGHQLASARRKLTLVDTVQLFLDQPVDPVRPIQGFEISVRLAGAAGPAQSGWVEATVGETQVGTARVVDGRAAVDIRFQAPRRERVPLSLRYVPEQPWYRAGPPVDVVLTILPMPLWAHLPWVALAGLAAFWIIRAWRRPRRRREAGNGRLAPTGRSEAVVVRRSPNASAWTGRVVDAHSGEPIADAELLVEVPGVDVARVLARATSRGDGGFELSRVDAPQETARLIVRASSFSELRQQLPPLGEMRISLVERRRSLLMGLTRWAKEMGRPWMGTSEPTPAHVADVARQQERHATRAWARDVEQAAYGPISPNEATESMLASRTPPLDRPPPHKR
jgi:hypothetical protein